MGKGDMKTARGKRFRGSYGVSRPRKASSGYTTNTTKEEKVATIKEKKAPAKAVKKNTTKKTTTKKTTAKKATPKKTESKTSEE